MCEDRDFTARARELGFRLFYEPQARVTHYPSDDALSDYLGNAPLRNRNVAVFPPLEPGRTHGARVPRRPALRLLLLPALSAAGTAYLVARNLPQCPDALPLSPLLFVGQVWWQWGGYEAMKMERRAC